MRVTPVIHARRSQFFKLAVAKNHPATRTKNPEIFTTTRKRFLTHDHDIGKVPGKMNPTRATTIHEYAHTEQTSLLGMLPYPIDFCGIRALNVDGNLRMTGETHDRRLPVLRQPEYGADPGSELHAFEEIGTHGTTRTKQKQATGDGYKIESDRFLHE